MGIQSRHKEYRLDHSVQPLCRCLYGLIERRAALSAAEAFVLVQQVLVDELGIRPPPHA
jgi:hypothetical protein